MSKPRAELVWNDGVAHDPNADPASRWLARFQAPGKKAWIPCGSHASERGARAAIRQVRALERTPALGRRARRSTAARWEACSARCRVSVLAEIGRWRDTGLGMARRARRLLAKAKPIRRRIALRSLIRALRPDLVAGTRALHLLRRGEGPLPEGDPARRLVEHLREWPCDCGNDDDAKGHSCALLKALHAAADLIAVGLS